VPQLKVLQKVVSIYYYQGNLPEALKNDSVWLKISEEIGDKDREEFAFGRYITEACK
jgi:hypothetical protein